LEDLQFNQLQFNETTIANSPPTNQKKTTFQKKGNIADLPEWF
jgi:hypothetical protein